MTLETLNVGGREIVTSKAVIEKAMEQCRRLIEKGFQVEHYTKMLSDYKIALRALRKPHANRPSDNDGHVDQRPSRVATRIRSAAVKESRSLYKDWQGRMELGADTDVAHDDDYYVMAKSSRPRTRGDCWNGPRPCPFVGCKYNLWLDVHVRGKSKKYKPLIKPNRPDKAPWEMPSGESCALDSADLGGMTLEDVGDLFTLTRERVRQIEENALTKMLLNIEHAFEDLLPIDNDTNWDTLQNETH